MLWAGDDTPSRSPGRLRRDGAFTLPADAVPILVVDDDAHFCAAVTRAVASLPFQTFSVRSAAEAASSPAQRRSTR